MKKNLPVTQRAIPLKEGQVLISGTDLKGAVTHCNDEFTRVSGFSREELVGHNHNIVRHPDVPPAVYADLWVNLKAGKTWMGIVKNRAKNGDHYWVDAYITPIRENGQVIGYESVRHAATQEQIARAEILYKRLNEGKKPLTQRDCFSPLWWPVFFTFLTGVLGMAIRELIANHTLAWVLNAVVIVLSSIGVYYLIRSPLDRDLKEAREVFHNPLASFMYRGKVNPFADISTALYALKSRARAVVHRLSSSARAVSNEANGSRALVVDVQKGIARQQSQADQLSAAMTEMAASIAEVARHARSSAEVTVEINGQAQQSRQVLTNTISTIETLNRNVGDTSEVVARLAAQSNEIGSFVSAIHGIADQTNLLALNAAIEAARAGEQGRGFAVVADEVRSLATRTQEATEQIQEIISALQLESEKAVSAINQSREGTQASVAQVREAGNALAQISNSMSDVHSRTEQIATAAEQQSSVAGTINGNVDEITAAADTMTREIADTVASVDRVAVQAKEQGQLAERLG